MSRSENVVKIVLLAPFEGRYREVGYNALYAARLALQDSGHGEIDLLAVDDGGTLDSAVSRARALRQDSDVRVAVVLGYAATHEDVQYAFGNLPLLIVGNWTIRPNGDTVFILSSRIINDVITTPARISVTEAAMLQPPIIGGEVFGLDQFHKLRKSLRGGIAVLSSGRYPSADFGHRYMVSDSFAPEPGLLATLTYDAVGMAVSSIVSEQSLGDMTYEGINGTIRFKDGYWADAPVQYYQYDATGKLVPQS